MVATLPVNLHEYEPLARAGMSPMAWDYLAGGGGDERTLAWNRERLDATRLSPRVLHDVSDVDMRLSLLGVELPYPVLLAPTGFQRLFHPEGELATARGAAAAGALYTLSTAATTSIEDIAAVATGPLWFQMYVQRDRGFTRELVRRAEAAGCRALVLTVDTPVLGARDRERRHELELPPGLELANLRGLPARAERSPTFVHNARNPFLDPSLTWEALSWLVGESALPVVVKGVLRADDAARAVERGAAAIAVSNHGGRNLDTVPATIDVLPRIAAEVAGRVPLLLDGGVRRGVDVVKAIALGASAVMIGRPYLWGLGAAGADGVARVLRLLAGELEMAMAQCGAASLAEVTRDLVFDG
ncbi:MAG TPA: alpha-hydroxy acid oxidase [Candidatus Eisenbacteria bacterium]|jgi:4-hydroxymandelate oxidase